MRYKVEQEGGLIVKCWARRHSRTELHKSYYFPFLLDLGNDSGTSTITLALYQVYLQANLLNAASLREGLSRNI